MKTSYIFKHFALILIFVFSHFVCKPSIDIQKPISKDKPKEFIKNNQFIDPRDNEIYETVLIGNDTWFAQNLRFNSEGSMQNPEIPHHYGRYYTLASLKNACPNGWHVATDKEWNLLEVEHGMPVNDTLNMGWRGEHAIYLKSTIDWDQNGTGKNSHGFNVLPAGYYFSDKMEGLEGMQGISYSSAFWTSVKDEVAYARFIFSTRNFVNKWDDNNNDSGAALSCRCVKNTN